LAIELLAPLQAHRPPTEERRGEIMTDTRTEETNATAPGIATPSTEQFINSLADLMTHSTRTPILRRPDEYGME
jgi:hypothetical protein